ncbi:MAG: hypothetical protein EP343_17895 [Deltaproteobacteria bacterium]|nr:MAG: hypothetical protein EP343_17895 [Deltaproteobacteria bacterium]
MGVASYLAYPAEGKRESLLAELEECPWCDVVLSENSEVFILVLFSETRQEEKERFTFLQEHESLLCLAMTYAQLEEETVESSGSEQAHV